MSKSLDEQLQEREQLYMAEWQQWCEQNARYYGAFDPPFSTNQVDYSPCCDSKIESSYGYGSQLPGIGMYDYCAKCYKTLSYYPDYGSMSEWELKELEFLGVYNEGQIYPRTHFIIEARCLYDWFILKLKLVKQRSRALFGKLRSFYARD